MKKLNKKETKQLKNLINEISEVKKHVLYLDMDGTIADLYSQENWLDKLKNEDKEIYYKAEVIISEQDLLKIYPLEDYDIRILTMLAGYSTKEYQKNVINQKQKWLEKYYPKIAKNINNQFVEYGNCKAKYAEKYSIILDDNETIRKNWQKKIGLAPIPEWLAV